MRRLPPSDTCDGAVCRHASPDEDLPVRRGDHRAALVDHIHVVGQREHHPHESLFEMLIGRRRGGRVIGVDSVEERVVRVGSQALRDAGGREGGVLGKHVAAGARAPVGVVKGALEQPLSLGALGGPMETRRHLCELLRRGGHDFAHAGPWRVPAASEPEGAGQLHRK
jgi:hypothetical protein